MKLGIVRKAFAWDGHFRVLEAVENDSLLEKQEELEALVCARGVYQDACKEASGEEVKSWIADLPLDGLSEGTSDLCDRTLARLCVNLVECSSSLEAALAKVDPWKAQLSVDEVDATTLKDLLAAGAVVLKGSAARALFDSFKVAKQEPRSP